MPESTPNLQLRNILDDAVNYFKEKYLLPYRKFTPSDGKQSESKNNDFFGSIHIFSHHDTDGLTAASILALALREEGIGYQITILKQLEEQFFQDIQKNVVENKQFAIFSDFGSGQLNLFNKYLPQSDFLILDHHEPLLDKNEEIIKINGYHANPYSTGVNGSKEISGAGMAYLFALSLNPNNIKLAYLAVIGAIGDIQDVGPQRGFIGENNIICQDSINENLIETEVVPAIVRSKSLSYALAFTLPVEIPEIKGNIRNASDFLSRNSITLKTDLGDYRTLADLTGTEKKKLTSALVKYAIEKNAIKPTEIDNLIGTNYLISKYLNYKDIVDCKGFSKMLNACGRLNLPSIGLAACIVQNQNDKAIKKALKIMETYSITLKDNINWLNEKKSIKNKKSIQYFSGEGKISENLIGVICSSFAFSNKIDREKPIIGYTNSDSGFYKVSARCNNKLVKKGINLSIAIRKVCEEIGIKNKGGGHPPAAGAKIPISNMDEFLLKLDIVIEQQKLGKN